MLLSAVTTVASHSSGMLSMIDWTAGDREREGNGGREKEGDGGKQGRGTVTEPPPPPCPKTHPVCLRILTQGGERRHLGVVRLGEEFRGKKQKTKGEEEKAKGSHSDADEAGGAGRGLGCRGPHRGPAGTFYCCGTECWGPTDGSSAKRGFPSTICHMTSVTSHQQ